MALAGLAPHAVAFDIVVAGPAVGVHVADGVGVGVGVRDVAVDIVGGGGGTVVGASLAAGPRALPRGAAAGGLRPLASSMRRGRGSVQSARGQLVATPKSDPGRPDPDQDDVQGHSYTGALQDKNQQP